MANGQETPVEKPGLRAASPHQGGPLGSSGAAPEAKTNESAKAGTTGLAAGKPVTMDAAAEVAPATPDGVAEPEGAGAAADQAGAAADQAGAAADQAGAAADQAGAAAVGNSGESKTAAPRRRLRRRANPVAAARRVWRSTSEWAKRPSGRLVLPGIVVLLLLGAAGTAGAYLVPQALQAAPSPSATPTFPLEAPAASGPASFPSGLPTGSAPAAASNAPSATTAPAQQAQNGARAADALAGWAQEIGTKVGIPVVAVQAYGYAELVLTRTTPGCHLSWTTIAAIAGVESAHGSANGAVLGVDGSVSPPIYGLPLDGKGGRQLVRDTDQGTLDGDTTYDRAVGPLQFIPSTWNSYKVDADNNGIADPNDIDDASLTTATYLCQGGRDLSETESWWEAILSYNSVQPHAQKVFETANDYGRRSRS